MKISMGVLAACAAALASALAGCGAQNKTPDATPTTSGTFAQHMAAKDEWHGFPPPPPMLAKEIEQKEATAGHSMPTGPSAPSSVPAVVSH